MWLCFRDFSVNYNLYSFKRMIKILLADDHQVVRDGMKMLLEADERIRVVHQATNGLEVLEMLAQGSVDMVITDINMPHMDGLELLKIIKTKHPAIKVVMLSMHDSDKYLLEAHNYKADGYLLKNMSSDELIFAIKYIYGGKRYVCAELSMSMADRYLESKKYLLAKEEKHVEFSSRELEILQLIAEGLTNVEMSERLFLSKRTIEGHRQNLLDKTGVRNSSALIRHSILNGYIQ